MHRGRRVRLHREARRHRAPALAPPHLAPPLSTNTPAPTRMSPMPSPPPGGARNGTSPAVGVPPHAANGNDFVRPRNASPPAASVEDSEDAVLRYTNSDPGASALDDEPTEILMVDDAPDKLLAL